AAIRQHRPEAVLYSGAPFRAAIVLPLLRLPYVVDLRDPWAWDATYRPAGWRARRAAAVDATLERAARRRAAALTTVSDPIAARYRTAYPGIPVHAVLGGFDPDDFATPVVPDDRFTLAYTGTFNAAFGHTAQLLLDSVAAFRDLRPDARIGVELVGDA